MANRNNPDHWYKRMVEGKSPEQIRQEEKAASAAKKMEAKPVEGRAYTPKQKKELLDRLYQAWMKAPELRLGQLISASQTTTGLFYVEDKDFIGAIEELCREHF